MGTGAEGAVQVSRFPSCVLQLVCDTLYALCSAFLAPRVGLSLRNALYVFVSGLEGRSMGSMRYI